MSKLKGKYHDYFNEENDNNEIDSFRAMCNEMNSFNLWMLCQRLLINCTEAQMIFRERFPDDWEEFDRNAMGIKKDVKG